MKKIVFVNNNMEVGGVQKALVSLLQQIQGRYDITLVLFSPTGAYMQDIPDSVRVLACRSRFSCLGVSQSQAGSDPARYLCRAELALVTRMLGRKAAMMQILPTQPMLEETYDAAISFLHNGSSRLFYGGCQEFVLEKIRARKKIAFIHCDYRQAGGNTPENNRQLQRFDRVAACSRGCREALLACVPELESRCSVVENCHDFHGILERSGCGPEDWPEGFRLISVARLGKEKGLERGIRAVDHVRRQGIPVSYRIVGDGPRKAELLREVQQRKLSDCVTFSGASDNPYRYIRGADLLLIPSYHEAAPMVIDEAACIGVPILATDTTSAEEMITGRGFGAVCENSQEGLNRMLLELLTHPRRLDAVKRQLGEWNFDNQAACEQFAGLVGEGGCL